MLVSLVAAAYAASGVITVDDQDPSFVLTGSASDDNQSDGGYDGHFYYRPSTDTPSTYARWTPTITSTGLYTISGFVPYSPNATVTAAPVSVHAHGEVADGTYDQSIIGGDFHPVFGTRSFKWVAGGGGYIEMNDASGESATLSVGFDAFQLTRVGDPGIALDGEVCATTPECADVLVCDDGACREPCTVSGCAPSGTCDPATALCDVWPDGSTETGLPTTTDTDDTGLPSDTALGPQSEPKVIPGEPKCGCASGSAPAGWIWILAALSPALSRWRRRGGNNIPFDAVSRPGCR